MSSVHQRLKGSELISKMTHPFQKKLPALTAVYMYQNKTVDRKLSWWTQFLAWSMEKVTRAGVGIEWDCEGGQKVVHGFPGSLLQSLPNSTGFHCKQEVKGRCGSEDNQYLPCTHKLNSSGVIVWTPHTHFPWSQIPQLSNQGLWLGL